MVFLLLEISERHFPKCRLYLTLLSSPLPPLDIVSKPTPSYADTPFALSLKINWIVLSCGFSPGKEAPLRMNEPRFARKARFWPCFWSFFSALALFFFLRPPETQEEGRSRNYNSWWSGSECVWLL